MIVISSIKIVYTMFYGTINHFFEFISVDFLSTIG